MIFETKTLIWSCSESHSWQNWHSQEINPVLSVSKVWPFHLYHSHSLTTKQVSKARQMAVILKQGGDSVIHSHPCAEWVSRDNRDKELKSSETRSVSMGRWSRNNWGGLSYFFLLLSHKGSQNCTVLEGQVRRAEVMSKIPQRNTVLLSPYFPSTLENETNKQQPQQKNLQETKSMESYLKPIEISTSLEKEFGAK